MSIRLSGMVSGMDTDSMVKELVKAYSTKKDNLVKEQTKLSWKQDAWKSINTKIHSFYSKTLSNMRFSSSYNTKATSVSDTSKASVIAGEGAVSGSQTLSVKQLAKAGYLTGGKITTKISGGSITPTADTTLADLGVTADSTLTLTSGGKDYTINLNTTSKLSDIAAQLSNTGVGASYDATNQRFFINAKTTGQDSDFSLTAGSSAAISSMNVIGIYTGVDATNNSETAVRINGQDAEIFLNGAQFTSTSNTFSINGLTITAKETTGLKADATADLNDADNYNTVSLTTDMNVSGIYDNIKNFLKEYNTLIKEMDSLYGASSAKGYEPLTSDEKDAMTDTEIEEWEKKIKDALLRRDDTLDGVINSVKTAMTQTYTIDGSVTSLSTFGINTLSYFLSEDNEKGVYHINGDSEDSSTSAEADKLKTAIAKDPESVANFFQKLTSGLYDQLSKKMSSTSMSSAYTVYNDKQMKTDYDDYKTKISDQEKKLKNIEDKYYKQFSAMESAMAKLNSSQSALSGLLGNS